MVSQQLIDYCKEQLQNLIENKIETDEWETVENNGIEVDVNLYYEDFDGGYASVTVYGINHDRTTNTQSFIYYINNQGTDDAN